MLKNRISIVSVTMSILAALASPTGAQDFLFDFQRDTEPDIGIDTPGAIIITPSTPLYNVIQGYGFLSPGVDEARIRGGIDSLLQDFVAINTDLSGAAELRFRVDLTPGLYRIQSWNGDTDNPRASRMILSFDGGTTEHLFYGSDTNVPNAPLPGTFMTRFAEDPPGTPNSGLPMVYNQTIPAGKSHSGLNYNMEFGEILQVDDIIQIDGGSLTFMVGSFDRLLNAIRIDLDPVLPEPPTDFLFDFQGDPGGSNPGLLQSGYTAVLETTLYTAQTSYGFLDITDMVARLRSGSDSLMRDFVGLDGGEANVFRADLPNGDYDLHIFGGDLAFANHERFMVSLDGGSSWTLYGADYIDKSSPVPPLPGTFFAVATGAVTLRRLEIPFGKSHSFANYLMDLGELLEVNDTVTVTNGHILIKSGALYAKLNAVEIVKPFVPDCSHVINTGGKLAGDLNRDCKVNLVDLLQFFGEWLDCTNPNDPGCM